MVTMGWGGEVDLDPWVWLGWNPPSSSGIGGRVLTSVDIKTNAGSARADAFLYPPYRYFEQSSDERTEMKNGLEP